MSKLLVLVVVLLILLMGLPGAMVMGDMAPCPSCTKGDAPAAVAMCLAIVSLFVLVVSSKSTLIVSRRQVVGLLLLADPPEKPPRVA
jgi:hypothetical protein